MSMTEEERARLCVAKFRDMPDDILADMPGTVMGLAEKYYRAANKCRKLGDFVIRLSEHAPVDLMREIATEVAVDMVASGDMTLGKVVEMLEGRAH